MYRSERRQAVIAEQITCDVCSTVKRETNHWLVAVTILPTPEEPEETCIAFAPIAADGEDFDPEAVIAHICGHACAVKRFSQWLETLTQSPNPKGIAE